MPHLIGNATADLTTGPLVQAPADHTPVPAISLRELLAELLTHAAAAAARARTCRARGELGLAHFLPQQAVKLVLPQQAVKLVQAAGSINVS